MGAEKHAYLQIEVIEYIEVQYFITFIILLQFNTIFFFVISGIIYLTLVMVLKKEW